MVTSTHIQRCAVTYRMTLLALLVPYNHFSLLKPEPYIEYIYFRDKEEEFLRGWYTII